MEEDPIQFGASCCINCEKKFASQDEDEQLSDDLRDKKSEMRR